MHCGREGVSRAEMMLSGLGSRQAWVALSLQRLKAVGPSKEGRRDSGEEGAVSEIGTRGRRDQGKVRGISAL